MPEICDAQRVRSPGEPFAILEVASDLGERLASLAGAVLVGRHLVDGEGVKAREELLRLLGEPLHRVDVSDVDIDFLSKASSRFSARAME